MRTRTRTCACTREEGQQEKEGALQPLQGLSGGTWTLGAALPSPGLLGRRRSSSQTHCRPRWPGRVEVRGCAGVQMCMSS